MGELIMYHSNVLFTFNTYAEMETYLQWTETSGQQMSNTIAISSREIVIDKSANTISLKSTYENEDEYNAHRTLNANVVSAITTKLADLGATRSGERG